MRHAGSDIDRRSSSKEDYVGCIELGQAKAVLLSRMVTYHRKVEPEFDRRRARIGALIERIAPLRATQSRTQSSRTRLRNMPIRQRLRDTRRRI